jgi:hypothetical protein
MRLKGVLNKPDVTVKTMATAPNIDSVKPGMKR